MWNREHRAGRRRTLVVCALAAVALIGVGCSSDSPTAPTQNPAPPPSASNTWTITLTSSTGSVAVGSGDPARINIFVRRLADNSPPSDGSTATVSTSLGSFNPPGQPVVTSGTVSLIGGEAGINLYALDTAGSARVTVSFQGDSAVTAIAFDGESNFFIESVSPNTGSPSGGESVRIRGGGFVEPVQVTFDGVPGQVQSVSSTQIRVITPAFDIGSANSQAVTVAVTSNVGAADQRLVQLASAFTFTRGGAGGLQVFSITPTTGPNEGGTRVTIRGDGFQAPVQVLFGDGPAVEATVESVTANQIVAITPAARGFGSSLANSAVTVRVRNVSTGGEVSVDQAFRYGVDMFITSIGPARGPIDGGQLVTIFGQGFDEPVAVEFGGFAQQVVSVTGTEIVARSVAIPVTGCSNQDGEAKVTNIETGISASGPVYVYDVEVSRPTLSSLSPSSGSSNGGTDVTVNGSNLGEASVEIGGRTAAILSQSANQVVVDLPPLPNSELATEACSDSSGGTGERYIDTAVDVTLVNQRTTCDNTYSGAFIYTPADGSCRITSPPPPPAAPVAGFSPVINGLTVNFNNTSTCSGLCSYAWSFGDGTNSNQQSPSHTYAAAGTYTVTLTVSNESGSSNTAQNVTVN